MKKELMLVFGILFLIAGIIFSFGAYLHYLFILIFGLFLFVRYLNYKSKKIILLNGKKILWIVIWGVLTTLLVELMGQILSPVWVYPFNFFNLRYDFWPSVAAYVLLIFCSYELMNFLLLKLKVKNKKSRDINTSFVRALFVLSFLLMIVPLFWKWTLYPGVPFVFFMTGFFLFSDLLAYVLTKESLIEKCLSSLRYLSSFILTFLILGLITEYTNLYQRVWVYQGIPLLNVTLLGIPIIVLLGWITLIGWWINLEKIVLKLKH